ncbi:DNA pilot protein [Microviridae sp.]|nr:DNA pilot protein [Microviridae sp.]
MRRTSLRPCLSIATFPTSLPLILAADMWQAIAGQAAAGMASGWINRQGRKAQGHVENYGDQLLKSGINLGLDKLKDSVFGGGGAPGPDPSQLGRDAKSYYDAAFPGTNPWERLGAGNPSSPIAVQKAQAKTQNQVVDKQLQMQDIASARQARAAGLNAAIQLDPDNPKQYGDYVEKGTSVRPGDQKENMGRRMGNLEIAQRKMFIDGKNADTNTANAITNQRNARVNQLNQENNHALMQIQKTKADLDIARITQNPGVAALMSLSVKAYKAGLTSQEHAQLVKNNLNKLIAAGIASKTAEAIGRQLFGVFGRLTGKMNKGYTREKTIFDQKGGSTHSTERLIPN